MGNFIDMGFCKEDDPIFTEGISVFTVRRFSISSGQKEEPRLTKKTREDKLPTEGQRETQEEK